MAVQVTDEVYQHEGGTEHERYVSGDYNSASVYDDAVCLTIGGNPDLELSHDRIRDLAEVLNAAVGLL